MTLALGKSTRVIISVLGNSVTFTLLTICGKVEKATGPGATVLAYFLFVLVFPVQHIM